LAGGGACQKKGGLNRGKTLRNNLYTKKITKGGGLHFGREEKNSFRRYNKKVVKTGRESEVTRGVPVGGKIDIVSWPDSSRRREGSEEKTHNNNKGKGGKKNI